jgi:hypothetical protein
MQHTTYKEARPEEFPLPVRNHYFYGKLLDVFHFELETDYMNAKRWLLNRLVTGWGVVCGLDVLLSDDGMALTVTPGLALDPWGREIVVAQETRPLPLPDDPWPEYPTGNQQGEEQEQEDQDYRQSGRKGRPKEPPRDEERWYTLVICYHECLTGPMPAMTGDCNGDTQCASGILEERYRLELRPGQADPVSVWDCQIPDAIQGGELQWEVLVRWVTDSCPELPEDACIPLANIRMTRKDGGSYCEPDDVNINIRPLTLSNRALFYLMMSMLFEAMPQRRRR